jgi:uncharacterized protein (UPF0128 family)
MTKYVIQYWGKNDQYDHNYRPFKWTDFICGSFDMDDSAAAYDALQSYKQDFAERQCRLIIRTETIITT